MSFLLNAYFRPNPEVQRFRLNVLEAYRSRRTFSADEPWKGFDFLGYHFNSQWLGLARMTMENYLTRATRLYEQERENPQSFSRLGLYVRHWVRWAESGLRAYKKNPAGAGSFSVQMDQLSLTPIDLPAG